MRRHHEDEKVTWLKSRPWWGELDDKELALLAATADRATVRAGRNLMHEGDIALEACVVVTGTLEVRHGDEVLATLGPGEVVGELGVMDRSRRTADVWAVEDTDLLVFTSTAFRQNLDESQHIREFVQQAAARHRGAAETTG